jgi:iron complex outermembrane receptor protein
MIRRVVFFLFFALIALKISAQMLDSIHSISGVEITTDKISVFSSGLKFETMDSTTLSVRQGVTVATLLSEQSAVSIRSYGPGGISTLTMRGTYSTQSGVFWNGINLQQPNMGMTDLSRISSFEFSDISLQSGGASALLGSGVIGGSLHLSNPMSFSTHLQSSFLLNASTIGNTTAGMKLSAGNARLAYSGSVSGDWDKNNFWFTTYSGEQEKLDHALVKSASSIQQAEYILNPKQRIRAGFWYELTDRQIPPTMTMSSSDQHQWDQAIRSSIEWTYTGTKQSFVARSAFIDEKEHFKSETALIDAFYHLNTFQADFEYKRYLGKLFSLGSGVITHITRADVPYYEEIEYQPDASLWLALAFTHSGTGIKSVLNVRQDFSKGYKVPLCPSLSAEMPVSKNVSVRFGVSGNYRIPTMNDKYWVPGGNPALKPENSRNLEAGAEIKLHTGELVKSKINLDIYSLWIDNMIQWIPVNSGFWSPQNVQKVWSRGIEISSRSDWKYAGFNGYFRFGYIYSPSKYTETASGETEILDKQLIYIPLNKVHETFFISKNAFYTLFSFTLTGKRYVQSNNEKSLPAYTLFDFYAGTTFKAKKTNFRLQAGIRNAINISYQSVLYYPEPGRSFTISLLISK